MKKYLSLSLLTILIPAFLTAQTTTKTEPAGGMLPKNWTKTTSSSTDGSLTKIIIVEIKDEHGSPKCKTTWKKTIDNKLTKEEEAYTASGKVEFQNTVTTNEKNEIIKKTLKYKDMTYTVERNSEGGLSGQQKNAGGNEGTKDVKESPEEVKAQEEKLLENFEDLEKGLTPKVACADPAGSCRPKTEIFVGYSYLSGDYGNKKEGFPAGGHFSVVFNFNSHIGAGVNISMHSKKTGALTLTRSFYMAEGRYVFQNLNNCDQNIFVDAHVLVGLGSEKTKFTIADKSVTNSGSGFAFGAGVSGVFRISNIVGIKAEADYIGVKYDGADEVNNNFRGSAGLTFWIGRRFYHRADVHPDDKGFFINSPK